MTSDTKIKHGADAAYGLNTPQEHRQYYDAWAGSYDADFAQAEGYAYPARMAALARRLHPKIDGRIADIGCGTGLVGAELRHQGFTNPIDGFDISQGMLAIAASKTTKGKTTNPKPIYDRLIRADLTDPQSYPHHRYGLLLSVGTFTLGHLGADTLEKTLTLANRGGFALIGINAHHFDERGFENAFTLWHNEGRITDLNWFEMGIYTDPKTATSSHSTAWVASFTIT